MSKSDICVQEIAELTLLLHMQNWADLLSSKNVKDDRGLITRYLITHALNQLLLPVSKNSGMMLDHWEDAGIRDLLKHKQSLIDYLSSVVMRATVKACIEFKDVEHVGSIDTYLNNEIVSLKLLLDNQDKDKQ